ncbi:MAG TPA: GYD domain-containing protein [Xanthobacteraceae bacterium]
MPTFIISMNWTDQAIRAVKEARSRAQYGRELGKKFGVEYKALYMTSGDSDLVAIVDAPNGDDVAKFVLALCSRGNVRTRTCRAWPETEYLEMISKLP